MRPTCTSSQAAVLRAATALLAEAGMAPPVIAALTAAEWASVTFDGRRETLDLDLAAPCVTWLVDNLPDREIPINGWILADLAVTRRAGGARIEVLVVRD